MPPPSYPTSCPNCGEELTAVVDATPDWAPWLSPSCGRGWWPAELTPEARAAWNPTTQAFDANSVGEAMSLLLAAYVDRDKARVRGISLLPEQVDLVANNVLVRIAARVDDVMRADLVAVLDRRGADVPEDLRPLPPTPPTAEQVSEIPVPKPPASRP